MRFWSFIFAVFAVVSTSAQEPAPFKIVSTAQSAHEVYAPKVAMFYDSTSDTYLSEREYTDKYGKAAFKELEAQIEASQPLHSDGAHLIWQRIVPSSLSREELVENILKSGIYTDVHKEGADYLVGKVNFPFSEDPERQYEVNDRPPFMQKGVIYSGTLRYDFKDGKFRVTLSHIAFDTQMTFTWGGVTAKGAFTLDELLLKTDGTMRGNSKSRRFRCSIYDDLFSDLFTAPVLKSEPKQDADW